jgi:transmembrane sensor
MIHLNTESRVKVKYGKASRDIRLLSGEALFKVERDPSHPFRVYAGRSVIQAVGTQFNVYQHAKGTTVAVLEGIVRITSNIEANPSNATVRENPATEPLKNLTVGQEVEIAAKGTIITRRIDVRQAAAWRQHRLVFSNSPLSDIAAEFNRYNRRPQIRIEDAGAAAQRFAATFDADAPESLIQVLQTNPDLSVERSGEAIVVRSRALSDSAGETR